MTSDSPELRPETRLAIDAVTRALDLAKRGAGKSEVSFKAERDPVTTTDIAVEDAIRAHLTGALGLPVVGEERGGEAPADGSPYWLVDPICGTRNFASGIPLYAVNLALVESGRVSAAVVGDPSLDEVLVAERGRGAWVHSDGARHSLTARDTTRTVMINDGKAKGARREHAARFMAEALRTDLWDVRSLGTTLTLPYLAGGRICAYAVFWVTAVHAAAGSLLATEAGCTLSDIHGRPWTLDSDSLLAGATPALHSELLRMLLDTAPQAG